MRNAKGINVRKYVYLTVSSVDDEIAQLLAESGVEETYLGVDHFNREALIQENKSHRTLSRLERTLNALTDNGIKFRMGVVAGAAKENRETLNAILHGVDWVVSRYRDGLNGIGVFPIELIPGSRLWRDMQQSGLCQPIFSKFHEQGFITRGEQKELTRTFVNASSDVSYEDILDTAREAANYHRDNDINLLNKYYLNE